MQPCVVDPAAGDAHRRGAISRGAGHTRSMPGTSTGPKMPRVTAASDLRPRIPRAAQLLVWAGAAACVAGFAAHSMWEHWPRSRSTEFVVLALLSSGLAAAVSRWRRWRMANALALVWLAALALMWGPAPMLSAALLALAALAAGVRLTGADRPLLAALAGAALVAGVLGWMLPLRLHFAWTYAPLMVALVAWRRDDVRHALSSARIAWGDGVAAAPRAAAWAVLAAGLASTGAWLPTMQYDDLAYHLGMPWQLMLHGRYALDTSQQVWALAPWAGDVLQSVAQLVAGAEARGPVNLLWFAAIGAGTWRLAGLLGATAAFRWAAAAVAFTLPTLAVLLGGMQTELAASAVLLAVALLAFEPAPRARDLPVLGALVGLLLGLKLLHPATALGLVAVALWRRRAERPFPSAAGALLLALAIGGSSYAYAWATTGNPVFPLLNSIFRSPGFSPVDFNDARWATDAPLALFWDLTFATSRHVEGWDGGFGFALVALAGAGLVALARRETRAAMLCALVAIVAALAVLPYARYALPGLVLMVPVAVRAVEAVLARRAALALLAALVVLDLAYLPNSGWMLRTGGVRHSLRNLGADVPLFERYTPERIVNARIRAIDPGARVLDFSGSTHAELAGRGTTAEWYVPRLNTLARMADADASGSTWARLLAAEGVRHVVLHTGRLPPARRAALARTGADRVLTIGEVEWWTLPAASPR